MLRTCENGCLIRCYTIGGNAVQTVEEYCDFGIIETPVPTAPTTPATPTASTRVPATNPITTKENAIFSSKVRAFAKGLGFDID